MENASPPPAPPRRLPWRRSTVLATLLGLVLPGLGQAYTGQPRRGALFLLAILPTFLLGWYLTDFSVVDPSHYGLDYAAQVFLGVPTQAARVLSRGHVLDHLPRFFDVGRLYVQVAGLLNLVALCDGVGEVIRHNRRVDAMRAVKAARAEAEPETPVQDAMAEEDEPEPATEPHPAPFWKEDA